MGMLEEAEQRLHTLAETSWQRFKPLLITVALVWLVEIIDQLVLNSALDRLGIVPRQLGGLRGIIFAPFLHGGFSHLLANTVPFLILGFLVYSRNPRRFLHITALIILIAGLGTWLVASANTVHIGASGVVFGYFAYLLVSAYHERSFAAIVLAILVLVFYGGLLFGVLPQGGGISWQGHLFGFVGGVMAAHYFAPRRDFPVIR